jgi:hypothetical protein
MKSWAVSFIAAVLLAGAVAKSGCHTREFYGIGLTVHNPTLRHKEMVAWLTQNARYCKPADYVILWNNLAEWAGTADSVQLRNLVIDGYNEAVKREEK